MRVIFLFVSFTHQPGPSLKLSRDSNWGLWDPSFFVDCWTTSGIPNDSFSVQSEHNLHFQVFEIIFFCLTRSRTFSCSAAYFKKPTIFFKNWFLEKFLKSRNSLKWKVRQNNRRLWFEKLVFEKLIDEQKVQKTKRRRRRARLRPTTTSTTPTTSPTTPVSRKRKGHSENDGHGCSLWRSHCCLPQLAWSK